MPIRDVEWVQLSPVRVVHIPNPFVQAKLR